MDKKRLNCKEIMTVDQVADLLQVNRITVIRYINGGYLSASKLGRIWRITKRDLEHFMGSKEISFQKESIRLGGSSKVSIRCRAAGQNKIYKLLP